MNLWLFLALYTGLLLLFIFSGMPVAIALGGVGLLSIYIWVGGAIPQQVSYVAYNAVSAFTMTAIPLFVLMGSLFAYSGLASQVYAGISPLLGRLSPGGLLLSNIFTGALFAAASGSAVAGISTISVIALPEMEKRGYNRGISAGSVAAAGALAVLIPPSIGLIIYGAMTDQSIGRLFIAGIFPGIVLTLLYTLYIIIRVRIHPHLAPPKSKMPLPFCLSQCLRVWPLLILIVAVIGSIYLGIATPTEAAAIGCGGSVVLAAGYRKLTWKVIKTATAETVKISAMVLLLFALARVMGIGLGILKVPGLLLSFVVSLEVNRYIILGFVYLAYLIAGMFMDELALFVMTIPVTVPILVTLGFDPIWIGVILIMLCECGMLSPPVGIALYIIQGIRPQYSFSEIALGAMPFWFVIIVAIIVLTVFPELATYLPLTMMG